MMTCPFETPLSLSARDRRSMHNIVQRCMSETMSDYEHVLASKSGLPVATRWKPVKRKQNITVYQDQLVIEEIKRRKRKAKSLGELSETARVGEAYSKSVGQETCPPPSETDANESTELPKMTWMGTVECELDDLIMASFATIEAANSVNKAAKSARKRKLNWLLATAESNAVNFGADQNGSCCSVCSRDLRSTFGHKSHFDCQICTNRVCHRCHVRQKLNFVNPDKNSFIVKKKSLDLCTRCVHTSTQMNARRVALEERARDDPASMYKYIPRHRKMSTVEESECAKEIEISRRTTENDMDYPTQKTDLLERATQVLHRFF
ncbi:hypothetical protein PR002_g28262 [Phytophthora rubi]|uniref:FYVE-type domain-containing protein n=1 Tax=Phytophthora rubi TaxID=129364 RepID=A0A6A3HDX5_9STRA|nr:hypothetical protein PR002_g28262 [Phytophthora rubi]